MACLDFQCQNPKCDWVDGGNHKITICPKCGGNVSVFFDEEYDVADARDYNLFLSDDDEEAALG